ncbi:MAG TPA: YncE family protein [Candidatus Sulfotelmatobacter sp.]|nr:YncE family protein [Candidatus Sulfotelmatobacter sp.]
MLSRCGFVFALFLAAALSLAAQSVVATIPVPGSPQGVAANPGNDRIYAALVTSAGYAVSVIDGATNTVLDTVTLTTGALVDAVNVTTGRIYIAGCTYTKTPVTCGVSVLDGNTNAVIATIPINASNGIGLEGIAVNPVTNRIYVSDATNFQVDVIDGVKNAIIANISFGQQQPLGLAVDFGTNEIIAAINGNQMAIMSGVTNTILRRINVGNFNANAAVNSFTSLAYITNEDFAPSTVGVINLKNSTVVANVSTGTNPFGVAVDIFSNLVFVTNEGDGTVAIVNGKTNTKIASVSTPNCTAIDVNPVSRLAYVSDSVDDLVYVISE